MCWGGLETPKPAVGKLECHQIDNHWKFPAYIAQEVNQGPHSELKILGGKDQ